MKKLLLAIVAVAVLLPSCQNSKPPVVLDSSIKIEVVIPDSTPAEDVIYICGPCTGGESFTIGNPAWKLNRTGVKCSISLDPEGFMGNYTLADGFHFVSDAHGEELDAEGEPVNRVLSGKEGSYVVAKWSK
ncbi:MAG: hypothetical protein J5769_03645 [Bacteroidales bacterium]|nr:hypothetical protein [Bacteroidales bacterium]